MKKEIDINAIKNNILDHLDFLINGEGLNVNEAIEEMRNTYIKIADAKPTVKPIVSIKNGVRHVDCPDCDGGYAHKLNGKYEGSNNNNYCIDCGVKFDWSVEK